MGRSTSRRKVIRIDGSSRRERIDTLSAEEPLEIRVAGTSLAVTMRTPGADMDLAAGFLLTEGVLRAPGDLAALRYCAGTDDQGLQTYNVLDAALAPGVAAPDPSVQRNFFTSSSCGLCGKASVDAVKVASSFEVRDDPLNLPVEVLTTLPDTLRAAQATFEKTGGLHAAGLFTADGRLLVAREDVGRHNAVDKVLGWAYREGLVPLRSTVLMVSGRASFELTQKALMAGVPMLAAVSAPSTLAAELAEEVGMTLVGFLRGQTMNVYSCAGRLT
ncbi:MAG: FdhD protein [Frankiaceae bacterium]|nr:FdhD protein [Frankiaceae bacterium]